MFYKLKQNGRTLNNIKSCVYSENCNSGEELRPGCVSSASIEVEAFGDKASAVSYNAELEYYRVDQNNVETLLGKFYAEPNIYTKSTYRFEAWDNASKLDADYSERLNEIQASFPMTLSELVQDAASVAGVTLVSTAFPLSTMPVQAFYAANITCRQILSWAAEIACRFVRCTANGEIEFAWYTENNSYSIAHGSSNSQIYYKQDGLHYENYLSQAVGRVAVRPTDTENAAYVFPASASDVYAEDPNADGNVHLYRVTVTDDGNGNIVFTSEVNVRDNDGELEIVGEGSAMNTLVISDNLLLTNAAEETYVSVAENIYNGMSAIGAYRPFECSLFPFNNPFRSGEIVSITDTQGTSFISPIMGMAISNSAAKLTAKGNETRKDAASDLAKQIVNLAENIVRIKKLKVDWAEIDTAVIDSLEANGINADWINVGKMSVALVDFSQPSTDLIYPIADDPSTLLNTQSVTNGWITDTYQSGGKYEFRLAHGSVENIRGQKVTIALEYDSTRITTMTPSGTWNKVVGEEILSGDIFGQSVSDIAVGIPPSISEGGIVSGNVESTEDGAVRNEVSFWVGSDWDTVNIYLDSTTQAYIRDISVYTSANEDFSLGYGNNNYLGYNGLKVGLLVIDKTGNLTANGKVNLTDGLTVDGTINQVGDLSDLETTAQTDIVSAINEIKSAVFYQSGDVINQAIRCFGYISSSGTNCTLTCVMPKMFQSGASVSATLVSASIRVVGGGYLGNSLNADLTSYVSSIGCDGSVMAISLVNSNGWTYGSGGTSSGSVPNNTPVSGIITFTATVQ